MYAKSLLKKAWVLVLLLPTLSVYGGDNSYIARGERGEEFHEGGYHQEGNYNRNVNREGSYNRGGEYSPNTSHGQSYGGAAARGYTRGYENSENNNNQNDNPYYVQPLMPGEQYQTQPDNPNQSPY